jgi:hypothetical protein
VAIDLGAHKGGQEVVVRAGAALGDDPLEVLENVALVAQ